jgi:hypothetical protein
LHTADYEVYFVVNALYLIVYDLHFMPDSEHIFVNGMCCVIDSLYFNIDGLCLVVDSLHFLIDLVRGLQTLRSSHPNFILRQSLQSAQRILDVGPTNELLHIFP